MDYIYKIVYSDIKKDILFNHYRAGKAMPTQQSLCQKYNISRMTLIKVLEQLKKDGLIYSRRGAGTFVRPRLDENKKILPLTSPIGTTYSHRDQNITTTVIDFSAHLPNDNEQKKLNIPQSQPVYDFKRIRQINGQHYSLEHTIMPTKIIPLDEIILKESLYDYLGKNKIFVTDVHRIVYADIANKSVAKYLQIPIKDPIFVIEQIAYDQKGRAFEYSTSKIIGHGNQFLIDIHL